MTELIGLPAAALPAEFDVSIALWVERESGKAVGGTVVFLDDLAAAVGELLLDSMQSPMAGPPRRPRAVVLRDAAQAAAVEQRLAGTGVEVRVEAELPVWDALIEEFARGLPGLGREEGFLDSAEVTPETVGEFFRASADFYRAAPWRVVDDTPLELHLPERAEPVCGVVMGGGGIEFGLALYFSAAELARHLVSGPAEPDSVPDTLAVSFDPERNVPEPKRAERRRHRWPVAGPAAFPMPLRTLPPAEIRGPSAEEFRLLTTALDTVREVARRHRKRLEELEPFDDTLPVTGAGEVRVVFPAPLPIGADDISATAAELRRWEAEHGIGPTEVGEGGRSPLFEEMTERIFGLPDAHEALERLAWSFFRDRAPGYLDDEDEFAREQATARFFDWAFYFVPLPPDRTTLAERALRAARDLSPEQRAERETFIHPIYTAGEVEQVEKGTGFVLRDLNDRTRYRVRERMGSYQVQNGWTVFGPLFPVAGGEWVLGTMSPFPTSPKKKQANLDLPPPEQAAADIEGIFWGAGLEWVEELERRKEIQEAWDAFREDLGGRLWSFATLERRIREADSPQALIESILDGGEWWTDLEVEVATSLSVRAWNLTTRPELGGRSPAQMHDEVRGTGPEELRLIQEMVEEVMHALMEKPPASAAALQKAARAKMRAWLTTPRPELDGQTPEEAMLAERRRRGTRDSWPGVGGIIQEIQLIPGPE